MKWWLISQDDARKIATALEDASRHSGKEDKRAFFEDALHTLHSGLHETEHAPADFPAPTVTAHGDPSMSRETASALGQMAGLAIQHYAKPSNPPCPKCNSRNVIEPTDAWPTWTCDACGHDFTTPPTDSEPS